MSLRQEERGELIRILQKCLSQLDGVREVLTEKGEYSALREADKAVAHTLECQQAIKEAIPSA